MNIERIQTFIKICTVMCCCCYGHVHKSFAADSTSSVSLTLNNEGVADLTQQNYQSAIAKFEQALSADPDYSLAKKNLEIAYNRYGLELAAPDALPIFYKAFLLNPLNRNSSNNLLKTIKELSKDPTYDWEAPQSSDAFTEVTYAPVQVVKVRIGDETKVFFFSATIAEATVKCKVTGTNIRVTPANTIVRGLSRNDNDPFFKIKAVDTSTAVRVQPHFSWHIGVKGGTPDPQYVYSLPFLKGSEFKITQGYCGPTHSAGTASQCAVDFAMPEGTMICAARDGVVVAFRNDSSSGSDSPNSLPDSNFITIKHNDSTYATYQHLKNQSVFVKLGDRIKTGQCIALSGRTGQATGPHLHFAVMYFNELDEPKSVPIKFTTNRGLEGSFSAGQILRKP